MSLTRQLFSELQPFFFDDPFYNSNFYYPPYVHEHAQQRNRRGHDKGALSPFNQNTLNTFRAPRHIFHESEDGKAYVVEAELPGVKKEDLDVRIGDHGRSVSIKARVVRSSGWNNNCQEQSTAPPTTAASSENNEKLQDASKGMPGFCYLSSFVACAYHEQKQGRLRSPILSLRLNSRNTIQSKYSVRPSGCHRRFHP
jgi:HSP20 family molecular chaperone IbpA